MMGDGSDAEARAGSSPESLTIRAAQASDASAIGVLTEEFAGYLRSLGDQTELQLTAEAYLRDGFGSRPAFAGLVAEANGHVVGYLLYHFGYDSDGAFTNLHIVDLYVHSQARRKGAGRSLMQAASEVARKGGAREMIWAVYRANDLAAKFYEGLGARRVSDLFFMKLVTDAL
ncbi:MAG TPA: GNAT family N-acetyltransferase [Candidatus Limnocylindria bacterium]|jgi:ribosomal protein S18 acetylase RimI-like enzyme|nr:GNAT family N-acetyltransferase [Candidatus Limnocylindria bacterium]